MKIIKMKNYKNMFKKWLSISLALMGTFSSGLIIDTPLPNNKISEILSQPSLKARAIEGVLIHPFWVLSHISKKNIKKVHFINASGNVSGINVADTIEFDTEHQLANYNHDWGFVLLRLQTPVFELVPVVRAGFVPLKTELGKKDFLDLIFLSHVRQGGNYNVQIGTNACDPIKNIELPIQIDFDDNSGDPTIAECMMDPSNPLDTGAGVYYRGNAGEEYKLFGLLFGAHEDYDPKDKHNPYNAVFAMETVIGKHGNIITNALIADSLGTSAKVILLSTASGNPAPRSTVSKPSISLDAANTLLRTLAPQGGTNEGALIDPFWVLTHISKKNLDRINFDDGTQIPIDEKFQLGGSSAFSSDREDFALLHLQQPALSFKSGNYKSQNPALDKYSTAISNVLIGHAIDDNATRVAFGLTGGSGPLPAPTGGGPPLPTGGPPPPGGGPPPPPTGGGPPGPGSGGGLGNEHQLALVLGQKDVPLDAPTTNSIRLKGYSQASNGTIIEQEFFGTFLKPNLMLTFVSKDDQPLYLISNNKFYQADTSFKSKLKKDDNVSLQLVRLMSPIKGVQSYPVSGKTRDQLKQHQLIIPKKEMTSGSTTSLAGSMDLGDKVLQDYHSLKDEKEFAASGSGVFARQNSTTPLTGMELVGATIPTSGGTGLMIFDDAKKQHLQDATTRSEGVVHSTQDVLGKFDPFIKPIDGKVADFIKANPRFTLMKKHLSDNGLMALLENATSDTPVTVFAYPDNAFASLTMEARKDLFSNNGLKDLFLKSHLTKGIVLPNKMGEVEAKAESGLELKFNTGTNAPEWSISGLENAQILEKGMVFDNGVVYTLDLPLIHTGLRTEARNNNLATNNIGLIAHSGNLDPVKKKTYLTLREKGLNIVANDGTLHKLNSTKYDSSDAGYSLFRNLFDNTKLLDWILNRDPMTIFALNNGALKSLLQKLGFSQDLSDMNLEQKSMLVKSLIIDGQQLQGDSSSGSLKVNNKNLNKTGVTTVYTTLGGSELDLKTIQLGFIDEIQNDPNTNHTFYFLTDSSMISSATIEKLKKPSGALIIPSGNLSPEQTNIIELLNLAQFKHKLSSQGTTVSTSANDTKNILEAIFKRVNQGN